MEFKTEQLEGSKVKFSFVVPAEEFKEANQKAYLKNRGKITIPGFRKGKAPLSRIQAMYGKGVFFEDAFDILFPEVYEKAITESGIEPVSRPDIDIQKIDLGSDLEFTCEVYKYPTVELGEYEGLSVKRYVHPVSEEDIEARLQQEVKKQARIISLTEGMVEPKDKLNLDYEGSVDGVPFEGGAAKGHVLEIGSGQFIPGFEDQLIGMDLGTEQDINVTFPTEYHSKELAGKEAVFRVKLNSVDREELPEVDDDFAADVSQFETLAEYKADLERQLKEEAETNADNLARRDLFDEIVKNAKFDLPTPMVETQMDRMMETINRNMQKQGYSLDMFLQMVGNDKDAFREQYREQATQEVSSELVLEELVKAINYEVTDADVDALLEKSLDPKDGTVEDFKKNLNAAQMENIRYQTRNQKTIDVVWEKAKVETIIGEYPQPEVLDEAVVEKAEEASEESETEQE
ncbi:MAG: trigger factor [Christensenellaceae bacterium]|nr:trigger factor [Christensenellaceae bacterium]